MMAFPVALAWLIAMGIVDAAFLWWLISYWF